MNENLVVPPERAGVELDEFLCLAFPAWNKRWFRRQVREGAVLVDGTRAHPGQRLRCDQVVSIDVDEELDPPLPGPSAEIPIHVLHEDDDYLVVDKAADTLVEPDRWDPELPNLVAGLAAMVAARAEGNGGAVDFRPRLVHRIDRGTSGVLLFAKTLEAERAVERAFRQGQVVKRYLALVEGEFPGRPGEETTIDLPIGPDQKRSGRQVVRPDGKPARTVVRVERRFHGFSLLACTLLTGRTHQIRVHLAESGFPLVVDPVYGRRDALFLSEIKLDYRKKPGRPERPLISRPTLHAAELELLPGPQAAAAGARAPLVVRSAIPPDLSRVLKQMEKVRSPRHGGPT